MAPFGFVELTAAAEAELVGALDLAPLPLPPELARAVGTWRGATVWIETAAYRGRAVRYARVARVTGAGLEIGNVLCLSSADHPLPILGADLVAASARSGMIAADLSPTLPAGRARDEQLAPFAARRRAHGPLPAGGELPAWCADWFSPWALYTRVDAAAAAEAAAAGRAFRDVVAAFVDVARDSTPRPELAAAVAAVQEGYAAAHRTDDKGLGMLARMFGAAWSARYVAEVLFPSAPAGAG